MPLSTYAKNMLMDHLLKDGVFMSIHLEDPGLEGFNEACFSSYQRQPLSNFLPDGEGERKSGSSVSFENMPESEISYIAIWDAPIEGNCLWVAELLSKKTIHDGDTLKISAGHFILGLT